MGKKGTKRKTKWRALPLGEEAGGSGNEEDLHDEDQSTTSSIVNGQPANVGVRRQSIYYKMADKPFRQTKRFTYDRFRSKEPLIKLESKMFDQEEYTKITTPRQDVLFKKGYFGRKRESSLEETVPPTGETEGDEPVMDQIIITNGFVDERGHYLVNGNSYEIYDPYSNTVTVVVGPPPYANGIAQPVLAAVSCQPVPLQPVDWYPPGADWPAQGSAWTPSYPRNLHSDSVNTPEAAPNFPSPDAQIPNMYNQQAYIVPGYTYSESPHFNGVPLQMNPPAEAQNSEENRLELKKTRRKSTECVEEEKQSETNRTAQEEVKPKETKECPAIAQDISEFAEITPSALRSHENQNNSTGRESQSQTKSRPIETKQVEKQSHSTQTTVLEVGLNLRMKLPEKESHSTQTPPEETFQSNKPDLKVHEKSNKILSNILFSSIAKTETEAKPTWKQQGSRCNNSFKKFREESPRKISHQRTNFNEEKKPNTEKTDSSPIKVSYAKKTMTGLENSNSKVVNGTPGKVLNGGLKNHTPMVNGMHQGQTMTNGISRTNNPKQVPGYEDRRNDFAKSRYGSKKAPAVRSNQKYKEKKIELKPFEEPEKKCEEIANESLSQSERSSTMSELSSPMELSSGQNTPPEKLIVQKIEEEINKSFEEKFKQNLTKSEEEEKNKKEEEENKREEEENSKEEEENPKEGEETTKEEKAEKEITEQEEESKEKIEEKPKGKKKKNKAKLEAEKPKEPKKGNKKKKKRVKEEAKGKSESNNSSEEIPFLTSFRQKDLLFGTWDELKVDGQDLMSEMDLLLNGDKEILKSLGLSDDKTSYSKLPLHSDLLMMLPTLGWSRPKLKIENFFAPAPYHNDLFTKTNITSMKSTKPEEFFASVIDNPTVAKTEKKKEPQKKPSKPEDSSTATKKIPKSANKASKSATKKTNQLEEEAKAKVENKEGKLGIVEAVSTWLQEQQESQKFISLERFENMMAKENLEEEADRKNGTGNPIHALSHSEDSASVADARESSGCIRVANVINDGFVHTSQEFPREKTSSRMYRSSSWDAKLSEVNIKKHFKFLTDSASFCQDLISDVRNGLPTGSEFATEELCDPKQTVSKYYTLAPNGRLRNESDSENEVFDALEYKFLTKETQEADGKCPDGNGNASITDSGVHSDMESTEDNGAEQKEATCKLQ